MDTEELMVDIINVFHTYYKKIFNKNPNENMFHDLDESDNLATNRALEFIYEHVFKHKENIKANNNNNVLLNEDDIKNLDSYDELYALLIDGQIDKLSVSLFSLIEYLVKKNNGEWYALHWNIMNLKNN